MIYGADGQPIESSGSQDRVVDALREALIAHGFDRQPADDELVARARAMMAVGMMLALSHSDMGQEALSELLAQAFADAVSLGPLWKCRGCGCTVLSLCMDGEVPCGWADEFLCTRCEAAAKT